MMPSAKSTAAITVTHRPNPSRLIAVRQPFHSRESRCRPESFGFAQTDEALIDEPIPTENSASRN